MNPYIQFQNPQDMQGLQPVFQNIAQQQALQNAALAQQGQLTQQAGQTQGNVNPMAMAMALRQGKPGLGQTTNSFGKVIADPTYGTGNAYSNMTSGELANMQQYGV
jgi:hypothetical protein